MVDTLDIILLGLIVLICITLIVAIPISINATKELRKVDTFCEETNCPKECYDYCEENSWTVNCLGRAQEVITKNEVLGRSCEE